MAALRTEFERLERENNELRKAEKNDTDANTELRKQMQRSELLLKAAKD